MGQYREGRGGRGRLEKSMPSPTPLPEGEGDRTAPFHGFRVPRKGMRSCLEKFLIGCTPSADSKWQLGKAGGSATSAAKTAALRANGKKGGRPKKRKPSVAYLA